MFATPTPELIEEELDYEYEGDFDDAASVSSVATTSTQTCGKIKYSDTHPAGLKLLNKRRIKWTRKVGRYLFVIRSQDELFRIHPRELVGKIDDPKIPKCIEDNLLKYDIHLLRKKMVFERSNVMITLS